MDIITYSYNLHKTVEEFIAKVTKSQAQGTFKYDNDLSSYAWEQLFVDYLVMGEIPIEEHGYLKHHPKLYYFQAVYIGNILSRLSWS